MTREFIDLLTFSEECVEFGKEELDFQDVFNKEVNYIEHDLDTEKNKINIVKGGELERNKKAVRRNDVDVLIDPVTSKEDSFDQSIATVARENDVAIGVTLKRLLNSRGRGTDKTRYIRSLEKLGKLIKRKKCDFVITSGADEKLDMRAPRELASIGYLLGFDEEESLDAVSENVNKIKRRKGV